MKWYKKANIKVRPESAQPQPLEQPAPAPKVIPQTETEQFFDWVQKYSPQLWFYIQDMENALVAEQDPKKKANLQQIYKNTIHRKFSEWAAKLEEAQKAGQPSSSIQLAMNWLDMVKISSYLGTDDLNIPDDSAMVPENQKLNAIPKPKKQPRKPKDHDSKVPGFSQEYRKASKKKK